MILRKPYAFLIKHFKLIHLILTILMFLFFQKIRDLVEYFNYYIDLKTFENITGVIREHFDIWLILFPLIIIAFIIIVMWLLIMKEKPVRYYIVSIVSYVIELIAIGLSYSILLSIQQGQPDANLITLFRDFLDLISYLPIPLMFVSLIRGIGFNIKQFNFKKDMTELNIADEDNEEFEVEVNVDTENIRSQINRKKRFIKYVYLENKAVFWIVGISSILIGSLVIYFLINGGEKIYSEGKQFKSYGVEVKVEKSYKTKYIANGRLINKDKFYIIVSLDVKNTLNEEVSLPYKKIYLKVSDDNKYAPTNDYLEYFNEFGFRYASYHKLQKQESKKIILVYELDNKYNESIYRLEYITKEDEVGNAEYFKIELSPKEYKDSSLVTTKQIGEVLSLNGSLLNETNITISEVEFSDKYTYTYKPINGTTEKEYIKTIIPTDTDIYQKTIMKIKLDLKKNDDLNPKVYSYLFNQFVTIEYESNGKTITQKPAIIDLTPTNSEYTYLEVVKPVSSSNKVALIFKIRDKEYRYELINKEEN